MYDVPIIRRPFVKLTYLKKDQGSLQKDNPLEIIHFYPHSLLF